MNAPSEKQDGWGSQLGQLVQHGGYRDFAHIRLLREAEKNGPIRRLLDIGCGAGSLLGHCRSRGIACAGIDLSPRVVRYHADDTRLPVIRGDVQRLPVRDSAFDLTVCHGLLEHLADPAGALREMRRVTSPGGRALVSVPARWSPFPLLAPVWYLTAGRCRHSWRGMIGRTYSRRSLRALLAEGGWEVQTIIRFKAASFADLARLPFRDETAERIESSRLTQGLLGIMICAVCRRPGEC